MGASAAELRAAQLAVSSEDADEFLSKIDEVTALVEGLAKGTVTPEVRVASPTPSGPYLKRSSALLAVACSSDGLDCLGHMCSARVWAGDFADCRVSARVTRPEVSCAAHRFNSLKAELLRAGFCVLPNEGRRCSGTRK